MSFGNLIATIGIIGIIAILLVVVAGACTIATIANLFGWIAISWAWIALAALPSVGGLMWIFRK